MRGTRGMRCALAVLLILALSVGWGAALAATPAEQRLDLQLYDIGQSRGRWKSVFHSEGDYV